MATTTITTDGDDGQVALINVFTVDPARQDELVAELARVTDAVMAGLPGFVSANLHASLDGTRVINYAQWASAGDFQAAMAREDVRAHLAGSSAIAQGNTPTLTRVRSIHHRSS